MHYLNKFIAEVMEPERHYILKSNEFYNFIDSNSSAELEKLLDNQSKLIGVNYILDRYRESFKEIVETEYKEVYESVI